MGFIEEHKNKITLGDSFQLLKKMPSDSADCVCTDPPYGMSFQSNNRTEKHKKIANDDNLDWLPEWVAEINRVRKDDAILFVFCSWHKVDIFKQEFEKYMKLKNILIWNKNGFGMGDLQGDFAPQHEMILFFNPANKPLNMGRSGNILNFTRTNNELHPTQKPLSLLTHLIEKATKEGDLVLDTFGGSCGVATVCQDMQRDFIVIEIEEIYHGPAQARLDSQQNQFTLFELMEA